METTYRPSRTAPHETPFTFKAEEEGQYTLRATLAYKEKSFINSGQSVSEKTENAFHKLSILKMFNVTDRVIYKEKDTVIVPPGLCSHIH